MAVKIKITQSSNGAWVAVMERLIGRTRWHYGHGTTPGAALKDLVKKARAARAKAPKSLKLQYRYG